MWIEFTAEMAGSQGLIPLVITHIFEEGARPATVWYKEDTNHSTNQQEAEQCSV